MRQVAALSVVVAMLLAAVAPAFASPWGNEFYPGDAPPSTTQAGQHDGTSASCGGGGNVCNTDGSPGTSGGTPAPTAGTNK